MVREISWSHNIIIFEGENASIGIILCKEKNRAVVEYALRETLKPIGVAQYRTSDTGADQELA